MTNSEKTNLKLELLDIASRNTGGGFIEVFSNAKTLWKEFGVDTPETQEENLPSLNKRVI